MADDTDTSTITLTAEIIASYAAGNKISASDLPGLIQSVHAALAVAGSRSLRPNPITHSQPRRKFGNP